MSSTETKTTFSYQIEKKPEGGFVARPSDPKLPLLEAATREELQDKIQATVVPFIQEIALEADRFEFEVIRRRGEASGFKLSDLSKPVSKTFVISVGLSIVLFFILYFLLH